MKYFPNLEETNLCLKQVFNQQRENTKINLSKFSEVSHSPSIYRDVLHTANKFTERQYGTWNTAEFYYFSLAFFILFKYEWLSAWREQTMSNIYALIVWQKKCFTWKYVIFQVWFATSGLGCYS